MKTKRVLSIVLCLVLALCISGCGEKKESDVPQPGMAMKTITQNSLEDYVTFEFELPEGWNSAPHEYAKLGAIAYLESSLTDDTIHADQLQPYTLDIGNYFSSYYLSGEKIPQDVKQMYSDLFKEKPETYKDHINRAPYTLTGGESSDTPPYGEDYIGDFQYKLIQGKNSRIAQVTYKYKIEDQEFHMIECYCEKIPYLVTGHFDDSLGMSSGDIALWVADSLKVQEHFALKNDKIEKKD